MKIDDVISSVHGVEPEISVNGSERAWFVELNWAIGDDGTRVIARVNVDSRIIGVILVKIVRYKNFMLIDELCKYAQKGKLALRGDGFVELKWSRPKGLNSITLSTKASLTLGHAMQMATSERLQTWISKVEHNAQLGIVGVLKLKKFEVETEAEDFFDEDEEVEDEDEI